MDYGLKKLDSMNRMSTKLSIILISVTLLAMVVIIGIFIRKPSQHSPVLTTSDGIDETPSVVSQIREIGQWEFLSISDEEMQDTIRKGIFSDDELIRIYYGTLRIGIDFSQCTDEWIHQEGDSLRIELPEVTLLDENFLDEARTKSFIEKGKWTNADRQQLAVRAKEAMKKRCLSKENLTLAQQNAQRQVQAFANTIVRSYKRKK